MAIKDSNLLQGNNVRHFWRPMAHPADSRENLPTIMTTAKVITHYQQLFSFGATMISAAVAVRGCLATALVKESLIESEIPCGTGRCRQN